MCKYLVAIFTKATQTHSKSVADTLFRLGFAPLMENNMLRTQFESNLRFNNNLEAKINVEMKVDWENIRI